MIGSDRYYTDKLAARKLKRCYEIAPPRVQQYLDAEIEYVLARIKPGDSVLELGCGYGRVPGKLASKAGIVVGVDTSRESLLMGKEAFNRRSNVLFLQMNALQLAFIDNAFDVTVCIQNGSSAFKVNQLDLIRESLRVTRPGGIVMFSSYSDKFWPDRLEWFQLQSREGLLGEINEQATGNGTIVCKDGFKATTIRPEDFISLASRLGFTPKITEVDESSFFYEIIAE